MPFENRFAPMRERSVLRAICRLHAFQRFRRYIVRNSILERSVLLAGLAFLAAPITACNTVEGAGEDVESVGHAVQHTADEAGEEMGEADDELGD